LEITQALELPEGASPAEATKVIEAQNHRLAALAAQARSYDAPAVLAEMLGLPENTSATDAVKALESRLEGQSAAMAREIEAREQTRRKELLAAIKKQQNLAASMLADLDTETFQEKLATRLAAQEAIAGYVAFHKTWLGRNGLNARRLSLVEVTGQSMEPALLAGDSVLVNHASPDPLPGRIFALRTLEGPLVKRLRKRRGRWHALSDNPAYPARALDDSTQIIGQVVWTARTLG